MKKGNLQSSGWGLARRGITSDNYKLHLELADLKKHCSSTYTIFRTSALIVI